MSRTSISIRRVCQGWAPKMRGIGLSDPAHLFTRWSQIFYLADHGFAKTRLVPERSQKVYQQVVGGSLRIRGYFGFSRVTGTSLLRGTTTAFES